MAEGRRISLGLSSDVGSGCGWATGKRRQGRRRWAEVEVAVGEASRCGVRAAALTPVAAQALAAATVD